MTSAPAPARNAAAPQADRPRTPATEAAQAAAADERPADEPSAARPADDTATPQGQTRAGATPQGQTRACGCGCGTQVARRYAPGHDARHKSQLAAAILAGGVAASRAADTMAELGWAGFADAAALRATPARTNRGRVIPRLSDVATWQVDHLGGHHAHRGCPRLTAAARLVGGTNPITRLASDRYVTLVASGPNLVAHLGRSWDHCATCSTEDTTRDEDAARVVCYKQAIWEGTPRTRPANAPLAWTVARDVIEDEPVARLICHRHPATNAITRTLAPPQAA